MSAILASPSAQLPTPMSSKKRKHAGDTKLSSKKRKQLGVQPESTVTPQPAQQTDNANGQATQVDSDVEEILVEVSSPLKPLQDGVTFTDAPPLLHSNEDENNGFRDAQELLPIVEDINPNQLQSNEPTTFHSVRISTYVPVPAIALGSTRSSMLSTHLAPLLLTYFAPAGGIVLSFSDPVMSAKPDTGVNLPLLAPEEGTLLRDLSQEVYTHIGDDFGACWTWLTATYLVFRPEAGDKLKGWTNVTSEGFIGLVSYNYFQTAVGKSRIPKAWQWQSPSRMNTAARKKSRKGRLNDSEGETHEEVNGTQDTDYGREDDATDGSMGHFVDADGAKINSVLDFHILDVELVPGQDRDKWSIQIDGTLLDEVEETVAREEDRERFENIQTRSRSTPKTLGNGRTALMSGGLRVSREGSVVSSRR